jgi:hypothetical protein
MSQEFPNSGQLRPNQYKNAPKHPDFKGNADSTCEHCGKESKFTISAWKRGERINLKFQLESEAAQWKGRRGGGGASSELPRESQANTPATSSEPPAVADEDDDVPF